MSSGEETTRLTMTSPEDVVESLKVVDEAFDARCAIELGVVELVVGQVPREGVDGLRRRLEAMRPLIRDDRFVDFERYLVANDAYHEYLVGLAGNEALLRAYRSLKMKGLMARALGGSSGTSDKVIEDHVRLTEAIAGGDVETAKAVIRDHAELAKRRAREAAAAQGLSRYLKQDRPSG
jgi:DNA-binding GntR family transcriptional regulator